MAKPDPASRDQPVARRPCREAGSPSPAPSCSSARPATWPIASSCRLSFSLPEVETSRPNARSSGSPAATGPTTTCEPNTRRRWPRRAVPTFASSGRSSPAGSSSRRGRSTIRPRTSEAEGDARASRPDPRHARQPGLLPGRLTRVLRYDHPRPGRGGADLPCAAGDPLEPGGHREAVRPRPRRAPAP